MDNIPLTRPKTPLLEQVDYPAELRRLNTEQLPQLAAELRQFLLYSVGQTGGHLGAGLGVVELTIALHYVFDTPHDKIVWDVGHQSYPHKILTGRRQRMDTMRQLDGLAPFTSVLESEYDAFGAGHSSTSISAALGLAEAVRLGAQRQHTVAVIGDGAMTAGMAFEALNHAGGTQSNLIVVFNDNSMSISDNVGALSNFFGNFMAGKAYINLKEFFKPGLEYVPSLKKLVGQTEEGLKHLLLPPSVFFEALGFNYSGILDGHDLSKLISSLKNIKDVAGLHLVHIKTCKGKGYALAEADPIGLHALTKIESTKAKPPAKAKPPSVKYTEVFSSWLCTVARNNPEVVAITPAMREGSGLVEFCRLFPERYYDVGIAEQHALTLAAGMAMAGLKPVVAIYSTFLQRAYDQLIHDVALQRLPLVLALDRSGLVGEDGATHHGNYDLSYLRCVPNLVIMVPSNESEQYAMLDLALSLPGPAAVRYPRGNATGLPAEIWQQPEPIALGKGKLLRQAKPIKGKPRLALLVFGAPTKEALAVAEQYGLTIADMRFVKPLDEELILALAKSHERLVTIEENVVAGGAGSAVLEFLSQQQQQNSTLLLGIRDEFIQHGPQDSLRAQVGLTAAGLVEQIKQHWPDFAD